MASKPKILIVSDVQGWAYDNVSNAIMKVLKQDFDFHKVYAQDLPIIDHQDYDLIYCMYWRSDFLERNIVPKQKLCLQVASFWSWQEKYQISLGQLVHKYLNRACAVSVNCPGLYELIAPQHPCVFLNPSGIDLNKFHPHPPNSTRNTETLVVGWTGSTATHGDNKGLIDIIQPACDALDHVALKTVTKENNWLPHDQMPFFYRDIDVYVCASKSEGTPNPILEAAASARAVISTPVGIVPMLIEQGKNGFIIERNLYDLTEKIRLLRDDRQKCVAIGQINRETIETAGWSWEHRALNYRRMFRTLLHPNRA
jgi:hypothetical protein